MKYELLSLFAGICCKLYDDLDDNKRIAWLNTPFILEVLKGFHYVSFTCVSLHSAAFFYFNYSVNILHSIFNSAAFSKPYEKSLWFTLGFLFFIVNPIESSFNVYVLDKIYIFLSCLTMLLEPLLFVNDISIYKLVYRSLLFVSTLALYFFYNTDLSDFVKCTIFYVLGYVLVSSIVQYYSLFVAEQQPPLVVEETLSSVLEKKV
jgi:hypothetical protein